MKENYENQLDAIRVDLYEQTKFMTNSEATCHINDHAMKIAEQNGIEIVRGVISYVKKNASSL